MQTSTLNISALWLTSILAIMRFVFLIKEKNYTFETSVRKGQKCLPQVPPSQMGLGQPPLGWPSLEKGYEAMTYGNAKGVCWQVLPRPYHSAPGTSAEAILLPFPFRALTLSEEALCLFTFGDLRIFWQLLEPRIIFSEICLASFRDLSFRPRHNYSCFGSNLATVTVLFLSCHWRWLCPSQWGRKVPIASGPWLWEARSP